MCVCLCVLAFVCMCVSESCHAHNFSCMIGFKITLAEMIIITRRCVANKNRVAGARVKVKVRIQTLCIGISETCSCPIYILVMLGRKQKLFGANDHHYKKMCREQNHIVRLKVKVTVSNYTLCTGVSDSCLCPAHNFIMHGVI